MPPKKNDKGKSKKTETKQKQKKVEDLTFGLKNKNKSAKVRNYVEQVKNQVNNSGKSKDDRANETRRKAQEAKKEEEKRKQQEFMDLFKPVQQQKVPFGVDPKTVLCEFFKAGTCTRGSKCKFSHDKAVERKSEKIDLYTDMRDAKKADTMDKWDQKKLEEVTLSKHGNPRTTTTIVCKYFLEAIENGKYGWFWECPNGGDKCIYRHALPPGFVLKKDKKPEEKEEISLEEFLETERHKLGTNLTPVTLESFQKWKQERKQRKEAEELKAQQAKERAFKAGKMSNMSGRDFFEFNPQLDDGEGDDDSFDFAQYRNADGGYQQAADYSDKRGNSYDDAETSEPLAEKLDDLSINTNNKA
ncbi:Translation machinery-associated protein 46 [Coemansia brasiliensis]|uniref:Translation machinery-associated protein 46 n=1 Tax=Coemansia brasiliensis TaxID=2650707 RepID=A0A9W8I7B4_9FUNG|nr:Translation machinery-associated protein 46 [Coemansia brasiliensis]